MLQIGVICLLPEIFASLQYGVVGRAISNGLAQLSFYNPRDWGLGTHNQVDDKPYGGGPGMVMLYEPLEQAIRKAQREIPEAKVVYLSPQGKKVCQKVFNDCANKLQNLILIAGRYEGIDERIIENLVDEEWSVGDFVLSGGEVAATLCIDAIIRLLPGTLGNAGSAKFDSFMDGLLDCPHYTKPAVIAGLAAPKVLLSGNHQEITRWRRKQAIGRTKLRRPDMIEKLDLSDQDKQLLAEFMNDEKD